MLAGWVGMRPSVFLCPWVKRAMIVRQGYSEAMLFMSAPKQLINPLIVNACWDLVPIEQGLPV